MKLGETILKKLNKKYEPSATIPLRVGQNDLVIRTDADGNAVQAFIGKADEAGMIKGDRYSRTIIRDREDKVIKDYWERKGKAVR